MIIVGIDENGLGPRLGPLVATAACIRVRRYRRKFLQSIGDRLRVTDSKRVSGFGKMAHCESIALALAQRQAKTEITQVDQFIAAVSLDTLDELQSPCPSGDSAKQCWSQIPALPLFGGSLRQGSAILDELENETQIRIEHVQSIVQCTRNFNRYVATGKSKFQLDVELFERLAKSAHRHFNEQLKVICGFVGGVRDVPKYAADDFRSLQSIPRRTKHNISYTHAAFGEVSFEANADANHLPVAIASMLGKYLRECWMLRITQYYQAHDTNLQRVSGYHDPKTRLFIEHSQLLREKLGVLPECFERSS